LNKGVGKGKRVKYSIFILKYYGETLLNNECTLKNKRQKFKTDPVRG
jgi:hypothetical protein